MGHGRARAACTGSESAEGGSDMPAEGQRSGGWRRHADEGRGWRAGEGREGVGRSWRGQRMEEAVEEDDAG
jgi:hypothetical protein